MTAATYIIRPRNILLFQILFSKYASATTDRNFKKGVVFDAAQSCSALDPHETSGWWYSWGVTDGFGSTDSFSQNKGSFCPAEDAAKAAENARSAGMDFVPMFWRSIPDRPFDDVVRDNFEKSQFLLTFNEPESYEQADLSPHEVAQVWPDIVDIAEEYELQIVAPCSESGGHGRTWYEDWKQECENLYGADVGCVYDFICIHMYFHPYPCADGVESWACIGEDASAAKHTLQIWYDSFGSKPIWVTEFACAPWGGHECTEHHHTNAMKQLGSLFEESPLVYRYAWFSLYSHSWKSNTLNSLVWHGHNKVGCANSKWKGAWGNADWQIQTIDQCVSVAESDDECYKPLSVSIDDDNCYCARDDCKKAKKTWPGMTTYKKVGNESFAILTDIGNDYESLGSPLSAVPPPPSPASSKSNYIIYISLSHHGPSYMSSLSTILRRYNWIRTEQP